LDALPRHNHSIYYNTSGVNGGVWGSGNNTGGNYGNPDSGVASYAYTSYAGGPSNPMSTLTPYVPSYSANYYIAMN